MSIQTLCSKAFFSWSGREKRPTDWLKSFPHAYRGYKPSPRAIGMTTDQELCFLETYAEKGFTGKGRIVDLGCWLGATTISLARGLEKNPAVPKQRWIDASDLFVWRKAMEVVARKRRFAHSFRIGDDLYDWVQHQIEPYESWVNLEKLDLNLTPAQSGPIEFLFVDAMKSWPLANRIMHNYLPRLIPGESFLVQQDFAFHHPTAATNHLMMWLLRDHFEWVYHVPRSASVVYRCKNALPPAALPEFTPSLFTLPQVNDVYDYSLACVSRDARHHLRACKLCFLLQRGWDEAAAHEAESMPRERIKLRPHIMRDVIACLNKRQLDPMADEESLTKVQVAIDAVASDD